MNYVAAYVEPAYAQFVRAPLGQVHDHIINLIVRGQRDAIGVFISLPLGWRRFVLDVYPYADVSFLSIVVFALIGSRFVDVPKPIPWSTVGFAMFVLALVGAVMVFQLSLMIMAQSATHSAAIVAQGFDISEVESVSPFVAIMPMDVVFGWTQRNVTELLTSLKPVEPTETLPIEFIIDGIKAYQAYLWADTFAAIPLYVWIHHKILGFLYTDDDTAFFATRAPFLLGSLDFFENIGHLISTYTLAPFSELYLQKLESANHGKFLLFMAIIGLEVSGALKHIGVTVSEELSVKLKITFYGIDEMAILIYASFSLKTSGLASTVSDSQKKGEDKRKARLEKKKKN
ncbi:hypothetical protein BDR26DRAFT_1004388, partial [Obelidium mucronatum]